MCVCFCLGACAYLCVCESFKCVWVSSGEKNLPFDSLTTHCVQQKYWVLLAWLHFFVLWGFWNTTLQAGEAKWESLICTFSSRKEIRMIDAIFQETSSKNNTWSKNVTYYLFLKGWTGFKNSMNSVWLLDKTLWALTKWQEKKLVAKNCILSFLSIRQLEWFTHTVLQQEYFGRGSLPAAVMKFRTFRHQQWILHKWVKYEFITQDEKHVTFATLNKMNGSLSHLHSHPFLWLCHEVNLIYW